MCYALNFTNLRCWIVSLTSAARQMLLIEERVRLVAESGEQVYACADNNLQVREHQMGINESIRLSLLMAKPLRFSQSRDDDESCS